MKMKQRRISVMLISLFCLLTLAGCSGQREIVSDATPVPSVTPEVVQAPIPDLVLTEEERQQMQLPDDLNAQALETVMMVWNDPFIDMTLSTSLRWQRVKESGASQVYYYMRGDESGETSFSISSHEKADTWVEPLNADEPVDTPRNIDAKRFAQTMQDCWTDYTTQFPAEQVQYEYVEPMEQAPVGAYTAGRINFQMVVAKEERYFGTLYIWETETRQYWCTILAQPAYYVYARQQTAQILKDGFFCSHSTPESDERAI